MKVAIRIVSIIAILFANCADAEDLLFFCKSESCTAKVTKDEKFQEVLEISDGTLSQRINLNVGQQFFLTAEFVSLERRKVPELVVYNEWGTGLQSLVFQENKEKQWVQVFEHVAKSRVQFFFMTDSMQAAFCDDGNGNKISWHYAEKSDKEYTIIQDMGVKK